ncbi:MAG: RDD family protein [Opitutaceae bacterium]
MEDPSKEQATNDQKSAMPPPLKPSNVLDSIFQPNGPMPAAGIGFRGLGFLLDFVLLVGLSTVLLVNFGLPANHPSAVFDIREWFDTVWAWAEVAQTQPISERSTPPDVPPALFEALSYSINVMFVIFWVYFGTCEAFFNGTSLGKRLCCIRTVSTVTLGAQPILTGIIRGGIKTTMVFILFPVTAPLTLIGLLFNKRRQLLHDLLSRTAVIDERMMHNHD